MRRLKESCFAQFLSFFALALFIMPINAGLSIANAAAMKPTTKVSHKPIKYFVPGNRIILETTVKDSVGITTVRCYFKAKGEANFVFVTMTESGGAFQGILPAPSHTTEALEYLFLVVNAEKQIVKTQSYMVEQKDTDKVPAWQFGGEGNLTVSTELAKAPAELAGFTDSVIVDAVESAARFGAVAGLYDVSRSSSGSAAAAPAGAGGGGGGGGAGVAGAASGGTVSAGAAGSSASSAGTSSAATTATGATMAGTVTATAGLSTAVIIGAGAAVAAGAAAAGGGGGGGGGGSVPVVTACDALATAGSDTAATHTINLGKSSGTFLFYYEAWGIKDRWIVTYEGRTLYDTGCISGGATVPINYSGSSTSVTVNVIPNCEGTTGTGWEFSVSCP